MMGCGSSADLTALEERVDALEAENDTLAAALQEATDDLSQFALAEDLDDHALTTDLSTVADDVSTLANDLADLEGEAVILLDADMTVDVATTDSLSEAVASLDRYRIASDVVVTIQLADGTHTLGDTVDIRHPNGDRIQIVGNTTTPANVVLDFDGDGAAIQVADNHALGLLAGVMLTGDDVGSTQGILAVDGGSIECDRDTVIVDGFDDGYKAANGGIVVAHEAVATNNTQAGFRASNGGVIDAFVATATGNGTGFDASGGSVIDAAVSTANTNHTGYSATGNAVIWASSGTATGNSGPGVWVESGGVVDVRSGTLNTNNYQVSARTGGIAYVVSATVSGDIDPANPDPPADFAEGAFIYGP
jgi:hypothetical protein